jgi:hypothetical protein
LRGGSRQEEIKSPAFELFAFFLKEESFGSRAINWPHISTTLIGNSP